MERVLETEAMDTPEEADDYDSMDHSEVNRAFVADLLAAGLTEGDVLDLGTGTAQIPIELCRQNENVRIMAVDMATYMLDLARINIEIEGLIERIFLDHVDAKELSIYQDGQFHAVISNSIVHHIPDPKPVLAEVLRITAAGGLIFIRDLVRPADDAAVKHLVETYAGNENEHQRQMFDDSLRAALDLDEIRRIVREIGFDPDEVQLTSDRHWTWSARKPR